MKTRLLPILLLVVALFGCGGSSSSGGGSNPLIYDFRPARANIDPGNSTLLVANFVGGKGVIDEVGPVLSGVPMPVSPAATTTYHLTVTADDGTKALATTTLSVGPRSVEISPAELQMFPGETRTFFVLTTGLADPSVTWSADGGTIDQTGTFTAPAQPGRYLVSAASKSDPTLCAKSFVTVSPVSVGSDGTTFRTAIQGVVYIPAFISGATNPTLIYTVLEPNGGTMIAPGQYQAPNAVGTYHVVVQSAEDPNVAVLVTMNVGPLIVIFPSAQVVAAGKPFAFHAVVMGVADTSVTWSVTSANAGTVDANGVYTAGAGGTIGYVQATSAADPNAIAYAQVIDTSGFSYTGGFTPTTGAPSTLRTQHAMARLLTNAVLVCGGLAPATATASAEVYDPSTDTFSATNGAMTVARARHTATTLANGKVLVAGGRGASGSPLASAELYDPYAGTFTALAAAMTAAREDHQAFLLPNGRVLLAGGRGTAGAPLSSLELFDPLTNTFSAVSGGMSDPRVDFAAGQLSDGRIFLGAGSTDGTDASLSARAQRFNGLTQSLGTAANLPAPLRNAATVSGPNGLLGIFGGLVPGPAVSNGIRFYDPAADAYSSPTVALSSPRNRPLSTILATGETLILGGTSDAAGTAPVGTLDVYDPVGRLSIPGGNMPAPWIEGVSGRCLLLQSGQVLITGSTLMGAGAPIGALLFQ
jgi:hypothetical protein